MDVTPDKSGYSYLVAWVDNEGYDRAWQSFETTQQLVDFISAHAPEAMSFNISCTHETSDVMDL